MMLNRDEIKLADLLAERRPEWRRGIQNKGDFGRFKVDVYSCSSYLADFTGSFNNGARAWFGGMGPRDIGHPHPQKDEEQGAGDNN